VADGFSNLKTKRFFAWLLFSISVPFLFWIETDNSDYNNHNSPSCAVGKRIQRLLNKGSVEGFARFCPTKANHPLVLLEKFQIFQAWSIK
jgi:hypothetical protein